MYIIRPRLIFGVSIREWETYNVFLLFLFQLLRTLARVRLMYVGLDKNEVRREEDLPPPQSE